MEHREHSPSAIRQIPSNPGLIGGARTCFTDAIENKLVGVTDYVSKMYRRRWTTMACTCRLLLQARGAMLHSPKNCLPGNGWFIAQGTARPSLRRRNPFTANSYTSVTASTAGRGLLVSTVGSSLVADEYLGRIHLMVDSLTKGRSDAALIRISVPFEDDAEAAERTALDFI